MAGKNVHEMDNGAPVVGTDELYLTRAPYGIGDDRRVSLYDLAPFIDKVAGVHGTKTLGNGVSSGSVTGLDLDSGAPTSVLLTIQSPAGKGAIAASLVGPPTDDGFDFVLTAITDSADYVLHYHVFLL